MAVEEPQCHWGNAEDATSGWGPHGCGGTAGRGPLPSREAAVEEPQCHWGNAEDATSGCNEPGGYPGVPAQGVPGGA